MAIKDIIGTDRYEKARAILAGAFPSSRGEITDDLVDRAIEALWLRHRDHYQKLGLPELDAEHAALAQATAERARASTLDAAKSTGHQLYMGQATHHRVLEANSDTPMASEFVGHLPLVRVSLPAKPTLPDFIPTSIGEVFINVDHLLPSVQDVAQNFGNNLGYAPARVDLITPARLWLTRFAAVALYLGYRSADDTTPSFYILEGGTAVGQAKTLYLATEMGAQIDYESSYQPTPFAAWGNSYRGTLTMTPDGQHPQQLVVTSTEANRPQNYITVTVNYEQVTSIDTTWPMDLTLEAIARVALIGEVMGWKDLMPCQELVAVLARELPWVIQPHRKL